MNQTFAALLNLSKKTVDDFATICSPDDILTQGLARIVKSENDYIEFNFAGYNFLLKREIKASIGLAYLKTYELVMDNNNYPNNLAVHLTELDIVVYQNTFMRFVNPNKQITSFNNVYVQKIADLIEAREKKQLPPN